MVRKCLGLSVGSSEVEWKAEKTTGRRCLGGSFPCNWIMCGIVDLKDSIDTLNGIHSCFKLVISNYWNSLGPIFDLFDF